MDIWAESYYEYFFSTTYIVKAHTGFLESS